MFKTLCPIKKRRANAQIGTFGFARNTSQCFAKPKEPIFLPTLGRTNNKMNEFYIDKRDKKEYFGYLNLCGHEPNKGST
jgi:hypothetical protein